ncbi:MAG: inositol monophosphatase [Alphaproteobacteria bacterium]|nr:inositol monophosphatase [Alphaproteobacteria bacterium]
MNPATVTSIVRSVAETEILPRFRALAAHQIREKGPGNLVTEADTEAELRLAERLTALLPGSAVVGEEAVADDPGVLDALTGDRPVWVLDPVDGTGNFARGRPLFAVIVALVRGGRTLQGWIHDPLSDITFHAIAGRGAWAGDRRLSIAAAPALGQMAGSLGWRRNRRIQERVRRVVRQGSVAHDYLCLAESSLHFALYRRLNPWDHAAGVLMHHEAGGHSALLDGQPYRPLPNGGTDLLLAPDRQSWQVLRDLAE